MHIDRCYFCQNIFDETKQDTGRPLVCGYCPFSVTHYISDSNFDEFDWITMNISYKENTYQFEFNPAYPINLFLLKLHFDIRGVWQFPPGYDLISTLKLPNDFSPQIAEQYLPKILRLKAFL